jgi:hypothetical protein
LRFEASLGKQFEKPYLENTQHSSFCHLGDCGGLLETGLLKGKYVWKAVVQAIFVGSPEPKEAHGST